MQLIDQGEFVEINGVPQWLTLRGADTRNPVVLVIGGPGGAYAALAPLFADWERDFTLVQWDQPGAGFTFGKSGAEASTFARLVDDGLRVAELACARLGVRRLALLCFSGGTIVGLDMVKRRPELFSAYVANGQVVDCARQATLGYELLLKRARERGDAAMQAELTAIGPPPYPDTATDAVKAKYAGAPTTREAPGLARFMAVAAAALAGQPAGATYLAPGVAWPEPLGRAMAAYTRLRSEIVSFDAYRLGREYAVPMFFLQGTDDLYTVTSEIERFAAAIVAPHVEFVPIEGAGHFALLLRHELHALLVTHVRPRLVGS